MPETNSAAKADRLFMCPTVTPLAHCPIFAELTELQRLRYNQCAALAFIDVVSFFEEAFAPALERASKEPAAKSLAPAMRRFLADEEEHRKMWRRLAKADSRRSSAPQAWAGWIGLLVRRPGRFPVVIRVMQLLEEHSMEVGRRCLAAGDALDPRFVAAHRRHLEDESRHVAVDERLAGLLESRLAPPMRWINRRLFGMFLDQLWRRPVRTGMKVVDAWLDDGPELAKFRPDLRWQLSQLRRNPSFQRMMFSAETTPGSHAWWSGRRLPTHSIE
jgi:hypothetical protein